jgi:choline dehydrogenase-like flavoprotein
VYSDGGHVFVEAHELLDNAGSAAWDIVIVGAGVAGLSIAKGLSDGPLRVLILESGGFDGREDAADLLSGTSNRDDYPLIGSRARVFGGTSTLWSGACIPLVAADFQKRPWVPLSGWPISTEELQPYYAPAARVFGHEGWTGDAAQLAASPLNRGDLHTRPVFTSKPLNVAERQRDWLARSDRIACCLGANVTGLDVDETGRKVRGVVFHDRMGQQHDVAARAVVLATGGIEAPRLLLAVDEVAPGGLGDVRSFTGRGYMDHPLLSVGILPVGSRRKALLPCTNGWTERGVRTIGTIGLSAETRQKHGLLDLHLRSYRYSLLEDKAEIIAWKEATGAAGALRGLGRVLRAHGIASLPAVMSYARWHLWNKTTIRARFDHVRFLAFAEQEPDPDNMITLGPKRDRYGLPLPHLHLTESAQFHDSVNRSCALLAGAFAANGFPGARMGTEQVGHIAHYGGHGLHHMGATRMSEDAGTGTVDRDCRVHGTANLFVAGSSVFPTGGAANPTFAISALAFRLADHLALRLRSADV